MAPNKRPGVDAGRRICLHLDVTGPALLRPGVGRHYNCVKTFNVYLRDGRIAKVHAETFRHEGEQYVFDKAGTGESQFFIDSEIAGISVNGSARSMVRGFAFVS
jgi:hypothetical protein